MNRENMYTHLHEIDYTAPSGNRKIVTIDLDETGPSRGEAGMKLGRMWFARAADVSRFEGTDRCPYSQDIPADTMQYAFTHGGEEYKAACRAVLAAIRAAESGATVHAA